MSADEAGFGPVVIGYDATDAGEDALALGLRLADATAATPLVATVHPSSPPGLGHVDTEWRAVMREHAEAALDQARAAASAFGGAQFRRVSASSAAHGLDGLAEEVGASAIVVGSGQGGPLRRITMGSTSERLLHGAAAPVVVAPRGHRERAKPGLVTVGCAFVDTEDGKEAVGAAARIARRAGARLRIFSVVAPAGEFALLGGRDAQRGFAEEARSTFRKSLDGAVATVGGHLQVTGELLEGNVVDALAALDDRDVDLLVCGSRGYGPVRRTLLGGTAARLVRRAAAPVMVVPRRG